MSMEDKKVRVLVNIVGGSGTINVPSWAPDSHHLAFVSYQMLPPEEDEATSEGSAQRKRR
jgi:TolB protein